ncbi:MAG: SAF domain-containing protein [Nakamurella sp.]
MPTERSQRRRSVRALTPRRRMDAWTGRRGGRRYRAARRATAVLLLLVAGFSAARPAGAAPGTDAVTVTRDLELGAVLTAADIALIRVAQPPDGALADPEEVQGRRLTSAVRRGEVLTDRRLVDTPGPAPGVGRSAVAVRPRDPALTQLLQSGTPVTVVSVTADGTAQPLSSQAWVLAVLDPDDGPGYGDRPVLLSVPDDEADRVVGATLTGDIALRLR